MSVVSHISGSMFTRYSFFKLVGLLSTVFLINMPCNSADHNPSASELWQMHELLRAEQNAKVQGHCMFTEIDNLYGCINN